MKIANYLLICCFVCCSFAVQAQDIHFSQFYHTPQNLNPALVGVFKGDYRGAATYRSQWSAVPVDYTTLALGGDGKIMSLGRNGIVSGGLQINLDQAGNGEMSLTEFGLSGGYAMNITRELSLSAGANVLFSNRRFNPDLLTWANQFNGDVFQEDLGSGETSLQDNVNVIKTGVGINLHYVLNEKSRTVIDFGTAMYQLNTPKNSFYTNPDVQLAARLATYANAWIQFHPKMDVKGHVLWNVQGDFSKDTAAELVVGTGIRYHLDIRPDKEKSIALLGAVRGGDAIIPAIEFGYRNWLVAFSYDINTSEFQVATNGRGGPELSVIYIFTKVAPPPVFKACPVF